MAVRHRYGGRQVTWGDTYRAFSEALLDCGEQLNERGKEWLIQDAEAWIHKTDAQWPHSTAMKSGAKFGGDRNHPWYSGQLHDSVAVRLAEGDRIISIIYMPQSAQTSKDGKPFLNEDGSQTAPGYDRIIGHIEAARRASQANIIRWGGSKALQGQLIVGVPYSDKVNESPRHEGYLEELEAQFNDGIRRRIGTALKRMMVKLRK